MGRVSTDKVDLDYIQWMKDNEITLTKCSIGHFKYGRGAIAIDDIKSGEVVIQVPDDMVMLPDSEDSYLCED